MTVCKIEDCLGLIHAKNLCNRHYRQMRKYGEIINTRYDKNDFLVIGDSTEIRIRDSRGNIKDISIIVGTEDIERLKSYKWSKHFKTDYVRAKINGKFCSIHRFILGVKESDGYVDHIDRNPLNNRKSNLRIVTPSENSQNRTLPSNNKSGVKGVAYNKSKGKWTAQINFNGHRYNIGTYKAKEEAIKMRLVYEKSLYGEYRECNKQYEYLIEEYHDNGGDVKHDTKIRRIKSNC